MLTDQDDVGSLIVHYANGIRASVMTNVNLASLERRNGASSGSKGQALYLIPQRIKHDGRSHEG